MTHRAPQSPAYQGGRPTTGIGVKIAQVSKALYQGTALAVVRW